METLMNFAFEMLRNGIKPNTASYPAALPDVVGVGALDQNGKLAAFTPYPAPWIALLAPGVGLTGAYVQGNVLKPRTKTATSRQEDRGLQRDRHLGRMLIRRRGCQRRDRGSHRARAPDRPPGAGGTA